MITENIQSVSQLHDHMESVIPTQPGCGAGIFTYRESVSFSGSV